jgi:hypothetical protein
VAQVLRRGAAQGKVEGVRGANGNGAAVVAAVLVNGSEPVEELGAGAGALPQGLHHCAHNGQRCRAAAAQEEGAGAIAAVKLCHAIADRGSGSGSSGSGSGSVRRAARGAAAH